MTDSEPVIGRTEPVITGSWSDDDVCCLYDRDDRVRVYQVQPDGSTRLGWAELTVEWNDLLPPPKKKGSNA